MSGLTPGAQDAANKLVDGAQELANAAVDLGEDVAAEALGAIATALKSIGDVVESLNGKLTGK